MKTTSDRAGTVRSLVGDVWPRIAGGLVLAVGLLELVVGGLTADSGLELYLLVWATACGSLWFVLEKAEAALRPEARDRIGDWLGDADLGVDRPARSAPRTEAPRALRGRLRRIVGLLLQITDVERQPLRSVGFVGVLLVSGLFALGLPFVLL